MESLSNPSPRHWQTEYVVVNLDETRRVARLSLRAQEALGRLHAMDTLGFDFERAFGNLLGV
jgi:hypothetical protein